MHWQIGSMSCEKTDSFHREHTQHEAETLEIIGPIAMERIFTARKCTGRIGSHWKWSEWLNHPSLRVEPCREAPHWSLLFQSGARLCAGIAQSKKTQKNHIRSTLLTHVRLFLATLYPCLECLYSFHFDDLGIVSLLFPFAYIRYQNFWAASCIINSHRENNESASHPVGFLECWEKPGQLHSFRNGWMSFSRFLTKFTLGTHPHFFEWLKRSKIAQKDWTVLHCEPTEEQSHPFWENKCAFCLTSHLASIFDTLQFQPESGCKFNTMR